MTLILASTSPYRHELLSRFGLPFECVAPNVNEQEVANTVSKPHELAVTLALRKAHAVSQRFPEAVVVGSDQVVDLDGSVLGKPGTTDSAEAQLLMLCGKQHRLQTAVAVVRKSETCHFLNTTTLWMRPLTRDEVRRYVAQDRPLDCAGSYKIERAGIALFERIDCDDFTAIMGLPLLQLAVHLRTLGYEIP